MQEISVKIIRAGQGNYLLDTDLFISETADNFTRMAGSQNRFFMSSKENKKWSEQTKPKISEGIAEKQLKELKLEQV